MLNVTIVCVISVAKFAVLWKLISLYGQKSLKWIHILYLSVYSCLFCSKTKLGEILDPRYAKVQI